MLKRKFYSGCPCENKENYFEQAANKLLLRKETQGNRITDLMVR